MAHSTPRPGMAAMQQASGITIPNPRPAAGHDSAGNFYTQTIPKMNAITKNNKFSRPTLKMIRDAEEAGDKALADRLWTARERMKSRYSKQSFPSQRQNRIKARRKMAAHCR